MLKRTFQAWIIVSLTLLPAALLMSEIDSDLVWYGWAAACLLFSGYWIFLRGPTKRNQPRPD